MIRLEMPVTMATRVNTHPGRMPWPVGISYCTSDTKRHSPMKLMCSQLSGIDGEILKEQLSKLDEKINTTFIQYLHSEYETKVWLA